MIKKLLLSMLILSLAAIAACTFMPGSGPSPEELNLPQSENISEAVFAGGCFWCTESDFEKVPGVMEVISGYTGGDVPNPEYKQVSSGTTGHIESVRVKYDPNIVSYKELLYTFWTHVDPTDAEGSFVDRGEQYRSAIFYRNEQEKTLAEQTKQILDDSGIFSKPIVTDILPLEEFYDAEDYHQDYYKKNSVRYNFYRSRSGRDQFLDAVWTEENLAKAKELILPAQESSTNKFQKPTDEELRSQLTEMQYYVTQEDGTEKPFNNEYWNNTEDGIYVDIVSGEPLYSSTHKYKSGTGWPSFTQPLAPENIVARDDHKLFYTRTEIRSKHADSHLGHVFTDGPEPTGLRYCMNSAALRFVPKEQMAEQGYGEYLYLFEE